MKKIILLIFFIGIVGLGLVKGASYPPPFTNTIEINMPQISNRVEYICGGCSYDDKCYSISTKIGEYYCSSNKKFIKQKFPEEFCYIGYECIYGSCDKNKCGYPYYISVNSLKSEDSFIIKEIYIQEDFIQKSSDESKNNPYSNEYVYPSSQEFTKKGNQFLIKGIKNYFEFYIVSQEDNYKLALKNVIEENKGGSKRENYSLYSLDNQRFFLNTSNNRTKLIVNNYLEENGIIKLNFTLIDGVTPTFDENYYFCNGYYLNETCYLDGELFNMSGESYFVEGKHFYEMKKLNDSCEKGYECGTGLCSNYICSLPYEPKIENEANNESGNSLITGAVVGNREPNWFGKVLIKLFNWFG